MSTWVTNSTATQVSQSIENNTSLVRVQLRVDWNGGSWASDSPRYYITINGNTKWGTANFNTGQSSSGYANLATHEVTVPHNDDGTGSVNWSVGYEGIYANEGRYSTASGTLTLTTIPRASKITGLTDFSIESPFSFTVDKPLTTGTDKITISSGTFSKTVSNYTSGDSISFETSELNQLYALNTTGTTIPLTITITTNNGTSDIGSNSYSCNGTFTATNPTFSGTINTSPATLIEGETTLNVTLSADAVGTKGATIAEYQVTVGGTTITSATRTTFSFTNVRDDTVTVNVVDSRGLSLATPATKSITITPYSAPTISSASVSRTPTPVSTSAALAISGTYSSIVESGVTASYRIRQTGGTYGSSVSLTLTKSNGTYSYSGTISGTYGMTNSYEMEITIADTYNSITRVITLTSGRTTVDIDTANRRVGIGHFVSNEDDQSLSVAGDIYEGGTKLGNKYAGYEVISQTPSATDYSAFFNLIYPVGSIYLSMNSTNPSTLFGGTWVQIAEGQTLWSAGSNYAAGTSLEAGLPNITGTIHHIYGELSSADNYNGAFYNANTTFKPGFNTAWQTSGVGLDASRSNPIYGNSDTVQPPAFVVYMWRRTA